MTYTLAFDVYGTLINTHGIFSTLEKLIGEKAKSFTDTWRNKQLEYSFRRGLMNKYEGFSLCTKEALQFCCEMYKVNFTSAQKVALLEEYMVLPVFPDVVTGLKTLNASGHSLYAFSNGEAKAVSKLLTNAKVIDYFDGLVSAENIRTFKPNPSVYEHFNKKTNSSKSGSWLISSNPFDVIGAASYGMNTAWVQRSSDTVFDPWGIEPTVIIQEISDLNKYLATKA
ncbi:haloacid dehalogenase type II [Fulvivirga sp. M361]|uniref:haloacid dehalogenase type II n=1 Tax=Fulvivirga sp. M361 TaxID=2594266 RepID=UPI001179A0B9|nr:haloacid dehalogenase type II [Fulvivirga sp. M361]TRX60666.1 haloacid dehalogenase type II [Fulvivirga sp. M361]